MGDPKNIDTAETLGWLGLIAVLLVMMFILGGNNG